MAAEIDPSKSKKRYLETLARPDRPAYIDPATGEGGEEQGLEEGDLVQDYFLPVRNLFTGGLKAVVSSATRIGNPSDDARDYVLERVGKRGKPVPPVPEVPVLDYGNIRTDDLMRKRSQAGTGFEYYSGTARPIAPKK